MQGKERDLSIALSLSDCLGPKKGTSILVRVAKLLRLSIYTVRGKIATKREYNDIQMCMYVNYDVHKICDTVADAA